VPKAAAQEMVIYKLKNQIKTKTTTPIDTAKTAFFTKKTGLCAFSGYMNTERKQNPKIAIAQRTIQTNVYILILHSAHRRDT